MNMAENTSNASYNTSILSDDADPAKLMVIEKTINEAVKIGRYLSLNDTG